MGYRIEHISKEGWIFISHDSAMDEIDPFAALVKGAQSALGGKIVQVTENDTRYMIDSDPLKLIFQWDDCFGMVVVVQGDGDIESAVSFVQRLCSKLNEQGV